MLGRTEIDVRYLEIDHKGRQVVLRDMIPVRVYVPMPTGYTGPAKGYTVQANFAPIAIEIPQGQWLTIVPEEKLPATELVITLPEA